MKTFALLPALALGAALCLSSCDKTGEKTPEQATADTAVLHGESDAMEMADNMGNPFDSLSMDLPEVNMPKRRGRDVEVRGNDRMSSYSLGENVLFKLDEATIQNNGEGNLEDIADNIKERFPSGKVRIYGFADSTGSKAYNKELSMKRAESVKQWLIGRGGITEDRITMQAMGEKNPITGASMKQDRRVVIAVTR